MTKNTQNLSLSSEFFQRNLLMPLDQATPVYLSGMNVIEYLWPLNDIFRPFIHRIKTFVYNKKAEVEADLAIEAFALKPVATTWEYLPVKVWRVLLERHQQLIMVAMANELANNPLTIIPQGLPKAKILPGLLLSLAHGMTLPYPVKDQSALALPQGAFDPSILLH